MKLMIKWLERKIRLAEEEKLEAHFGDEHWMKLTGKIEMAKDAIDWLKNKPGVRD